MSVLGWLIGCASKRGRALTLYKRGMALANQRDHRGAIDNYTLAIGKATTPDDVKLMVLYNRALTHVAIGDNPKALDDLEAVLAMSAAPVNVKAMARNKRTEMESQSRKVDTQKH